MSCGQGTLFPFTPGSFCVFYFAVVDDVKRMGERGGNDTPTTGTFAELDNWAGGALVACTLLSKLISLRNYEIPAVVMTWMFSGT